MSRKKNERFRKIFQESLIIGLILTGPNEENPVVITITFASIGIFYLISLLILRGIEINEELLDKFDINVEKVVDRFSSELISVEELAQEEFAEKIIETTKEHNALFVIFRKLSIYRRTFDVQYLLPKVMSKNNKTLTSEVFQVSIEECQVLVRNGDSPSRIIVDDE